MKEQYQKYKQSFRLYDIRGVYPLEVNEELAGLVGANFSKISKKVVVGYDSRTGSESMAKAFLHAAIKSGCDVTEVGQIPNPATFFHAFKKKAHGVYITASHNPENYNGIKIINSKGATDTKALAYLKEHLGDKTHGAGSIKKEVHASEEYISSLVKDFENTNVKIAIDCMNGIGGVLIHNITRRAGMRAIIMHDEPRPDFGGRKPEPRESNVHELIDTVINEGCDFGVAFDGDVDRVLFIDDKGKPIRGDHAGILIGNAFFKNSKISATINCTKAVEKFKKMSYTPIGRPYIEKRIVDGKIDFAFELSYHFYFAKHYPFSDGFLAMMYMAKLASKNKLSKERLKIEPYSNLSQDYHFTDTEKMTSAFSKIKKEYRTLYKKTNTMDGIRIDKNLGWILLRPSNTEPILRLTIETKTRNNAKKLLDEFESIRRKTLQHSLQEP